MGYAKAKGRSKGQYVMVRFDMMESPAWLSLTPKARCIWLEIMHRYNGSNNGNIPLSCREAGDLCGVTPSTAKKGFDELQKKGFIVCELYSCFTNKYKTSRRWRVTHEVFNERPPTNEWRKWKPEAT